MNDSSATDTEAAGPQIWERSFTNSVPALMRVIDEMSEFLSRHSSTPEALYHAQLAAEEMGTNIIKYGFDDKLDHKITLRVECLPDCFRLVLFDCGRSFDVRQIPEPNPDLSLDDRQPGGWGISLVRRLARRMDYERRDGLNVLTIDISR